MEQGTLLGKAFSLSHRCKLYYGRVHCSPEEHMMVTGSQDTCTVGPGAIGPHSEASLLLSDPQQGWGSHSASQGRLARAKRPPCLKAPATASLQVLQI